MDQFSKLFRVGYKVKITPDPEWKVKDVIVFEDALSPDDSREYMIDFYLENDNPEAPIPKAAIELEITHFEGEELPDHYSSFNTNNSVFSAEPQELQVPEMFFDSEAPLDYMENVEGEFNEQEAMDNLDELLEDDSEFNNPLYNG